MNTLNATKASHRNGKLLETSERKQLALHRMEVALRTLRLLFPNSMGDYIIDTHNDDFVITVQRPKSASSIVARISADDHSTQGIEGTAKALILEQVDIALNGSLQPLTEKDERVLQQAPFARQLVADSQNIPTSEFLLRRGRM